MAGTQNFLVALWRSIKSTNNWRKGERTEKLVTDADDAETMWQALDKTVRGAYAAFTQHEGNAAALKIFLAPEYFFAHREEFVGTSPHALEQGEKNAILSKLVALSRDTPNLLIVPGTIAWRRALDAPSRKLQASTPQTRRAMAAARVQSDFDFKKQHGLNADEYEKETAALVGKAAQMADTHYLKRNTCYLAFNGKILKYHKRAGFGEEKQDEKNSLFVPGHQAGYFSIGRVRFGLEVCFDHNQGYLRSSGAPGGVPHVHLIISNSTDTKAGNIACSGFVAHSSTQISSTQIHLAGKHDEEEPYNTIDGLAGWSELDLYHCKVTDAAFDVSGGIGPSPVIASDSLSEKTGVISN